MLKGHVLGWHFCSLSVYISLFCAVSCSLKFATGYHLFLQVVLHLMNSITGRGVGGLMDEALNHIMLSHPRLWVKDRGPRMAEATAAGPIVMNWTWYLLSSLLLSPPHPLGRQCSLWGQVRGLHGGRCAPHPGLWRNFPVPSQPEES